MFTRVRAPSVQIQKVWASHATVVSVSPSPTTSTGHYEVATAANHASSSTPLLLSSYQMDGMQDHSGTSVSRQTNVQEGHVHLPIDQQHVALSLRETFLRTWRDNGRNAGWRQVKQELYRLKTWGDVDKFLALFEDDFCPNHSDALSGLTALLSHVMTLDDRRDPAGVAGRHATSQKVPPVALQGSGIPSVRPQVISRLARLTLNVLSLAGNKHFPRIVGMFAKLGYSTDDALVEALQAHMVRLLPHMTTSQVVGSFWGVTKLHKGCMQPIKMEFIRATEARLQRVLRHATPHELTVLLCSYAMAEIRPSTMLEQLFLETSKKRMKDFSKKELLSLIWSVAMVRFKPEDEWMVGFWKAFKETCQLLTSEAASELLWSFGRMRYRPSLRMTYRMLERIKACHFTKRLKSDDASRVSRAAWGLAMMRFRPDKSWRAAFLRYVYRHKEHCTPALVTNILFALSSFKWRPKNFSLRRLCSRVYKHLHQFTPSQYATMFWAFGKLRFLPNDLWLFEFYTHSMPHIRKMKTRDLVQVVNSAALLMQRYRYRGNKEWLDTIMVHLESKLAYLPPRTLVSMALWLSLMRYPLTLDFLKGFLRCLKKYYLVYTGSQMATLCFALPRLVPKAARAQTWRRELLDFFEVLVPVSAKKLSSCTGPDLCVMVSLLAKFQVYPGLQWLASHEKLVCKRLAELNPKQVAHLSVAYMTLAYSPQEELGLYMDRILDRKSVV